MEDKMISSISKKPLGSVGIDSIQERCVANGITIDRLLTRLNELIDAKKTSYNKFGELVEEADSRTQLSAVMAGLSVWKVLEDSRGKDLNINLAVVMQEATDRMRQVMREGIGEN